LEFLRLLRDNGVGFEALETMLQHNPSKMLGLPEAARHK
jgi:predicted metal-dependent phosphotriesterase family hydrolase